ncbi:PilZ domain-containing protein [Planctomycetota bacterium]
MRWNIWSNRRQGERRSDVNDVGGRRKAHRREDDRRKFVRLFYPPTAAPKVLNANYRILDISENGIKFLCRDICRECTDPITLKSILDLKIQFHDGEVIEIKVVIKRCECIPNAKDKTYAGIVANGIAAERIDKEEMYLLNRSPQFQSEASA